MDNSRFLQPALSSSPPPLSPFQREGEIDFTITPIGQRHYKTLRRCFQLSFPADEHLSLLVLRQGKSRHIVGCAALYRLGERPNIREDGRFIWRIASDCRIVDGESRLVAAALELARQRGIRTLCSQEKIALIGDSNPLAMTLNGLERFDQSQILEVAYDEVYRRISRIHALLQQRRLIPDAVEVSGLTPALLPQVRARLDAELMLDHFDFDARCDQHHPEPIHLDYSTAVQVAGELAGFMIVAPLPHLNGYTVKARWVAPALRKKNWVNPVLVYRSVAQGVDLNLDVVRFNANPRLHQETFSLAKRLGGQVVQTQCRFGRTL